MGAHSLSKTICMVLVFCAATTIISAQTFTTLWDFNGADGDGAFRNGLVQATNGNFYGTTYFGGTGTSSNCDGGCGTVFEITPAGQLTTLHSFNYTDGIGPNGLVQATNGNFYGTTQGPDTTGNCSGGCGTVFEITPAGRLTTLHSFDNTEGTQPSGLVQATNGNFYGTTYSGGTSSNCTGGCGTVFQITPAGQLNTLHSFDGTDGSSPFGLVQSTNGNFYGATGWGGTSSNCTGGCGTVFEITPAGQLTTLHSFDGTDGSIPIGLVQATNGNFYGTTSSGGTSSNGTAFEITPAGQLTTLHSFDGTDGSKPYAGLVQATNGNFYGTTFYGGTSGNGTVFEITPAGQLTTLHSFNNTDGSNPAELLQATNGNFYGTTSSGGTSGNGTVYSLSVGLGPFVATVPTSGGVGSAVTILGTNLTGTTSVTFNGTAAAFNVVSATEITTVVPTGASTGTVQVTAPSGTLSSNVPFVVTTIPLSVTTAGSGTVASNDGDINCGNSCTFNYLAGTMVTLTATPASGWSFSGWSGGCSGTGSCNLTMTQKLSVGATFTPPNYILTVSTNGSGQVSSTDGFINCPGTCSHSYPSNSLVTLTAEPAQGWTFGGWSGCDSSNGNSCSVVIFSTDRSVSAAFNQGGYRLAVFAIGNGMGSVASSDGLINCGDACSVNYSSGTQVSLTATSAQGSLFSGWSGCDSTAGNICTVTMDGARNVTASFSNGNAGLYFVPVTPCRIADTRAGSGTFGTPSIEGETSRDFPIPLSSCNISYHAAAYSLNVTVVPHGALGFLTVWPAGQTRPLVSTLNSFDGQTKANAAIVVAGTSGAISMYASDTTDVVLDINGYFVADSGLAFYTLPPCRVLDTRDAGGPLGGPSLAEMQARSFPLLASSCNIPTSAQAYSLNVTAVPRGPLGFLSVWPTEQEWPGVSTLNAPTGTVVANGAIVPAGSDGGIQALASNDADMIVDINGYFAPAGTGGLSLHPAPPCRVLDTRGQQGSFKDELLVDVAGSACSVPSDAQAYVLNATVLPPGPLGFLALWPDGQSQPLVSTLNSYDGAVSSNMAIVPTMNGSIDAFASNMTQLILDTSSYFAP